MRRVVPVIATIAAAAALVPASSSAAPSSFAPGSTATPGNYCATKDGAQRFLTCASTLAGACANGYDNTWHYNTAGDVSGVTVTCRS